MHDQRSQEAVAFVMAVGRALHLYGAPTTRIEQAMELIAERLGLQIHVFAAPTQLQAAFGQLGDQHTQLLRLQPGSPELGKRARVDTLLQDFLTGQVALTEAQRTLDEIMRARAPYRPWVEVACFGLASAAAARFFDGALVDVLASLVAGLLVGSLDQWARTHAWLGRLFEPITALLVSAYAVLCAHFVAYSGDTVQVYTVTLAGLIVLLPGLTLTTATTELAARHLIAGTARFMGALLTFMSLGFGAALGAQLVRVLPPIATVDGSQLPDWTLYLALLLAPLAFTVLLRARRADAGWIVLAGAVAFAGSRFGTLVLGPELGAFLGALVLGTGSRVLARTRGVSAAVTLVPGILLLVPGSVGFASIQSLMSHDVVSGVETAFRMFLTAIALAGGLLVANTMVGTTLPVTRAVSASPKPDAPH